MELGSSSRNSKRPRHHAGTESHSDSDSRRKKKKTKASKAKNQESLHSGYSSGSESEHRGDNFTFGGNSDIESDDGPVEVTSDHNEQQDEPSSATNQDQQASQEDHARDEAPENDGWKQVRPRKLHRAHKAPPSPPPFHNKWPVIIQDRSQNQQLRERQWRLTEAIETTFGPITSIRPISPTTRSRQPMRLIVGCSSELQQSRLKQANSLCDTPVSCHVPVPKVEGVIHGVPLDFTAEDIIKGTDPQVHVSNAKRLTLRSGAPSRAILLVIQALHLPSDITIFKRRLTVEPYIHRVIQCRKCLGLGHKTADCGRGVICAACGSRGHKRADCKATQHRCVNCKGEHPATSPACPAKQERKEANRLRSQTYMPRSAALQEARLSKSTTTAGTESAPPSNTMAPRGWGQEPTYAEMASGRPRPRTVASAPRPIPKPRKLQSKPSSSSDEAPQEEAPPPSIGPAQLEEIVLQLRSQLTTMQKELAALKKEASATKIVYGKTMDRLNHALKENTDLRKTNDQLRLQLRQKMDHKQASLQACNRRAHSQESRPSNGGTQ